MINVGVINAQHLKNARAIVRTTKGRLSLPENAGRMA